MSITDEMKKRRRGPTKEEKIQQENAEERRKVEEACDHDWDDFDRYSSATCRKCGASR